MAATSAPIVRLSPPEPVLIKRIAEARHNHPQLRKLLDVFADLLPMRWDLELKDWKKKAMDFPDWVAAYTTLDPSVCLRLNHIEGGGCDLEGACDYTHVCVICGQRDHGVFMHNRVTGAIACKVRAAAEKFFSGFTLDDVMHAVQSERERARAAPYRPQPAEDIFSLISQPLPVRTARPADATSAAVRPVATMAIAAATPTSPAAPSSPATQVSPAAPDAPATRHTSPASLASAATAPEPAPTRLNDGSASDSDEDFNAELAPWPFTIWFSNKTDTGSEAGEASSEEQIQPRFDSDYNRNEMPVDGSCKILHGHYYDEYGFCTDAVAKFFEISPTGDVSVDYFKKEYSILAQASNRAVVKFLNKHKNFRLHGAPRAFRVVVMERMVASLKLVSSRARESPFFYNVDVLHNAPIDFWPRSNSARDLMRQLVLAYDGIHRSGVLHRDAKPENVLVQYDRKRESSLELKLCDFALSKRITGATSSQVQKPVTFTSIVKPNSKLGYWASPESIDASSAMAFGTLNDVDHVYGVALDSWGVGCMLVYICLGGLAPFSDPSQLSSDASIVEQLRKLNLHTENPLVFDLVLQLLRVDQNERSQLRKLLGHPALISPAVGIDSYFSDLNLMLTQRDRDGNLRTAVSKLNVHFGPSGWLEPLRNSLEFRRTFNKTMRVRDDVRDYDVHNVHDFVRFVRNVVQHHLATMWSLDAAKTKLWFLINDTFPVLVCDLYRVLTTDEVAFRVDETSGRLMFDA